MNLPYFIICFLAIAINCIPISQLTFLTFYSRPQQCFILYLCHTSVTISSPHATQMVPQISEQLTTLCFSFGSCRHHHVYLSLQYELQRPTVHSLQHRRCAMLDKAAAAPFIASMRNLKLYLFFLFFQTGFVKAFSSSAPSFTVGFAHVQRIMKTLFVKNLYLWPRFHAIVNSSLSRKKVRRKESTENNSFSYFSDI